jgi:predicted ATPase
MLLQSMLALRGKKFEIKLGNDEIIYKIKEPFLLEIYNKDGSKIPISLLSSGYSQVIPLDILVKRGRFVIIEEPELNLHAGAQVDIANYLSSLKNKKMFITTHSDIFTIQMAINHVKKKEETLNIYLLNKGTVQKIEYTEKGDVEEIPTITDVIRNQVKQIYGE